MSGTQQIMTESGGATGTAGATGAASVAAAGSTGATGGATAASGATGGSPWYAGIEDDALRGYAEHKAWPDPVAVVKSYQSLEKMVGTKALPVPANDDDVAARQALQEALGWPKDAAEYKLPIPEGGNSALATEAAAEFHKLGIPVKAAQGLTEWWNAKTAAAIQEQQAAQLQRATVEIAEIKREWGETYPQQIEVGRRFAQQFGLSGEDLTAIENAMGTGRMMKFLASAGSKLGEHGFETGTGQVNGGMSPAGAQARLNELKSDRQWTAALLGGDKAKQAEWARLNTIASQR